MELQHPFPIIPLWFVQRYDVQQGNTVRFQPGVNLWSISYSSVRSSISYLIGVTLVSVSFHDYRKLQKSRGDLIMWIAWIFCDFEGMGTMERKIRCDQAAGKERPRSQSIAILSRASVQY